LCLALGLMSLSLYVLAGLFTQALASSEASMKYFILGAFASSFLLYGIALMYGATGTTNLDRIAAAAAGRSHDPLFVIGMGLLLVGFGFKTSSVPFHMWVPDVYQGAPTSVTALIATGSKAAAFGALLRGLTVAFRGAQPDWTAMLWIVAALTMTVGNVAAIAQSNLKRMLAYSSIAHAGYMLVGLVAGGMSGGGSVLFYLLTYTFATAGAFGVLTLCERARAEAVEVGDYAGLAERHPVLASALALFLLSLIGVPPLAGFMGKFYVFGAAVRAGYPWLTVVAVLNSALAAYYYLRVVVYMYMREPEGAPIPGAAETIAALRADGRRVAFLSNKPLATRADYAEKLTRLGIPTVADDVINSSLVLARHLRRLDVGAPVFVIGEPPLVAELSAHGFEPRTDARVRWVVIAFDRTFDYAKLNTALQAVRGGARLIATNPDPTCPTEE